MNEPVKSSDIFDDEYVVHLLRSGDKDDICFAIELIYNEYCEQIIGKLRVRFKNLPAKSLVEDVLIESLTKIFEMACDNELPEIKNLSGYLYVICKNYAHNIMICSKKDAMNHHIIDIENEFININVIDSKRPSIESDQFDLNKDLRDDINSIMSILTEQQQRVATLVAREYYKPESTLQINWDTIVNKYRLEYGSTTKYSVKSSWREVCKKYISVLNREDYK